MLLNLLPGVRDIRVPLSAGAIWLLAAYLAVASFVPERDEATGALATVYDLASYFGSGAAVAAILFSAYLIGLLQPRLLSDSGLWALPWTVTEWIRRTLRRRRWSREPEPRTFVRRSANLEAVRRTGSQTAIELTLRVEEVTRSVDSEDQRLEVLAAAFGGEVDVPTGSPVSPESMQYNVMEQLFAEQEALSQKLRIQDKERLWLSYDQKTSEGEFRRAISGPILGLIAVLMITGSCWFALAVPIPLLLHRQGEAKDREARSELYQALLHGIITSQVLESVAEVTGHGVTVRSQRVGRVV